jgi:hypothetical protein
MWGCDLIYFQKLSWEQSAASLTFLLVMSFMIAIRWNIFSLNSAISSEWSLPIIYSPVVAMTTHIRQADMMMQPYKEKRERSSRQKRTLIRYSRW